LGVGNEEKLKILASLFGVLGGAVAGPLVSIVSVLICECGGQTSQSSLEGSEIGDIPVFVESRRQGSDKTRTRASCSPRMSGQRHRYANTDIPNL
jgi:hypothetical protein